MFETLISPFLIQAAHAAIENGTSVVVTNPPAAAQSAPETWTGFIIALTTLISGLSGLLVHYINRPKIKAVGELAKAGADKVLEAKGDIATLAKVTYNMLPEQAAQIADAKNVRIAALEQKLEDANAELSKLKTSA